MQSSVGKCPLIPANMLYTDQEYSITDAPNPCSATDKYGNEHE
ncbi:hypothetical protein [Pectobacterium sp. B1J-3]